MEFDDGDPEPTHSGSPTYGSPRVVASSDPHALRISQAVRVVVWQEADGVRVAPYGTTVSAITTEAMLVAVDPATDLAAWLKLKKK